ncbi:hypothetical protein GLW03_07625 [Halobacillus halophilus]|uniref:hypothetical protein n=1 Tax=Halobacillus TaxID=45667 RepID=UPI00136F88AE|nr:MULTISPECIES: hypothetical protein [Halobacillus]MCA1020582.1 hypothetical protein [Halobacillus litoralis]MYL29689.1 hypothetical protein [Halobacillus halophilus]
MKLLRIGAGGLKMAILYIVLTLLSPFILHLTGRRNVLSEPEWMGGNLWFIEVSEDQMYATATATGIIVSFLLGVLLYTLLPFVSFRGKKEDRPAM